MSTEGGTRHEAVVEPGLEQVGTALIVALSAVLATRLPFARSVPMETDEWLFVHQMDQTWFPIHHTLFQTIARGLGLLVGGHYAGLVALDMIVSALALVSVWWWLRALVRPSTALASTVVLGVSPLFWSLGEMAGNYTMIPLVGSFLLGVAYRGWREPKAWHPYASSVVLAVGTGYREDLGTFWLPVLGVILWRHRWRPALIALVLFTALNLAWLLPMLGEVGGWEAYRRQSVEFAHSAGYRNSVWNLGMVDASARYAVKLALALAWTMGLGLLFVPRGMIRLVRVRYGWRLLGLLVLAAGPTLGSHLLVHFGVSGYSFHYLPALLALMALGIGRGLAPSTDQATLRLGLLAGVLAVLFLFYPADFDQPGFRGDFDLAIGRYSRLGLQSGLEDRAPSTWRTSNSTRGSDRSLMRSIRAN